MNTPILDDSLQQLANAIITALLRFPGEINEALIEKFIDFHASSWGIQLTRLNRTALLRKIETSVCHNRPYSFVDFHEQYHPWFDAFWKQSLTHHYWDRYCSYLLTIRGMALQHVRSLDRITSAIVDRMENPEKAGPWSRRGMVVGQVQSGKTANYIGVAAKAADCGYRFIVIMAGTLNALRDQTQRRMDEGFIGKITAGSRKGDPVGVGIMPETEPGRTPTYLTTADRDFRKSSAEALGLAVGATTEPIVLVIKKNATTLKNLMDWIRTNTSSDALKALPFLLVDDEADNASVNVSKPDNEPKRINGQIRSLLKMFGRSCYLGYTATPFANIFIDPEARDEEHGDDLFPRDFILTLDPPDTYMGPDAFFGDESPDLIRSIHDVDETTGAIPIKHPKDFHVAELPESLVDALHVFVLAKTIRMARGEQNFDCSALVNASRFRNVHAQLSEKVREVMERIHDAVDTYSALDDADAMADPTMARLKGLFDKEYATTEPSIPWKQLKERLADAVGNIEVLTVNSDSTARKLDYSRENWPHGRTVVVVGGMSLSRGLTLEGLVVSYYLRNSIAYDTLMQMGRWFGYRPGYGDLCRVYMTDLCQDWYSFIALSLAELNDEFRQMEDACLTPKEFGLRVRAHPGAMIVTARNKMRTAQHVTVQLNYYGRLVETTKLSADPADHAKNRNLLARWLEQLGPGSMPAAAPENGWLWSDVPAEAVMDFSKGFLAHPLENLDKILPVCRYISQTPACAKWDVFLASRTKSSGSTDIPLRIAGLDVLPGMRKMGGADRPTQGSAILVNDAKRRVGYAREESAGLLKDVPKEELERSEKAFLAQGHKGVTGNLYRQIRQAHALNPLLIIHVVSSNSKDPADFRKNLVALSWSFPGDVKNAPTEPSVEYEVNRIWYENYLESQAEETDEFDDAVEDTP